MAIDARRRQKAAEKRKKREKAVKEAKAKERASSEGIGMGTVLAHAGEFPLVECVISKGWRERGLAHILLAKRLPNERLIVGGWYVDTLCLGIKDAAVLPGLEESDYENRIKPNIFHDKVEFEPCDPALAMKIALGAADFAENIGFKPSKRWGESRQLFAGFEPSAEEVSFGRDGKPCYVVRGESNREGIIARLKRALPEGSFVVEEEAEK